MNECSFTSTLLLAVAMLVVYNREVRKHFGQCLNPGK